MKKHFQGIESRRKRNPNVKIYAFGIEFHSDLREMFLSGAWCDSYNILLSPGECHLLLMSPFAGKASLQGQHEAPTPKGCSCVQILTRACSEIQQHGFANSCPDTCSSRCFSLSLLVISPPHMLCITEELLPPRGDSQPSVGMLLPQH